LTRGLDDGTVVGRSRKKSQIMLEAATVRQLKQDVMEAAENTVERRLSEESAALRLEIAAVRLEIAKSQGTMLRWMFAGWLTTMLAIVDLATKISGR
jgi:hypothetical protein